MDKIHENTLALLKSALTGCTPVLDNLTDSEWRKIYDIVDDQCVAALCFDAIKLLPDELRPPRHLFLQWAMFCEKTEYHSEAQKQAINKVVNSVDGLKMMIIKGFSTARYYPNPSHRVSGDIDCYCFDQGEMLDKFVEEKGVEISYENPRHSMFHVDGFKFENHRYFLYHRDAEEEELEQFIKSEAEKQRKQAQHKVFFGTPLSNAIFFLKHSESDFVFNRQNLKLRALFDWAAMLQSGKIDYQRLNAIKSGKTIDRFADALTAVCVKLLGLNPDLLHCFPPVKSSVLDDFIYMIINYQQQVKDRGTLKGRMLRLIKYLRHFRTYKYLFGKNILTWYYFRNYNKTNKK